MADTVDLDYDPTRFVGPLEMEEARSFEKWWLTSGYPFKVDRPTFSSCRSITGVSHARSASAPRAVVNGCYIRAFLELREGLQEGQVGRLSRRGDALPNRRPPQ